MLNSWIVVPIIIGTSFDCSGASGEKGWRGSTLPSTVGAHPKMNEANPALSASSLTFAMAFSPAARSFSYGMACSSSILPGVMPNSSTTAAPILRDHLLSIVLSIDPLWTIALWNFPLAEGVARRVDTFPPPPD